MDPIALITAVFLFVLTTGSFAFTWIETSRGNWAKSAVALILFNLMGAVLLIGVNNTLGMAWAIAISVATVVCGSLVAIATINDDEKKAKGIAAIFNRRPIRSSGDDYAKHLLDGSIRAGVRERKARGK